MNSQFATDLAAIFTTDEHGISVTYTPSGGEGSTIVVIPEENDTGISSVVAPGDSWRVWVQYADVAAPGKGDIITRGDTTWYLIGNVAGGEDDGAWLLEFSQSGRRII